jgi:Arc/MetJ-type ribon-helix-helix transcriptional regulator
MTPVHLSEDLESFIRDAVRGGLYPSKDAVISDALVRLRNATDTNVSSSDESGMTSGPGKKLTKQGFQRHLVKIGLLDPPPETDSGAGNSLDLVDEEGEIVNEVIIRERLIEWLTGFLEK